MRDDRIGMFGGKLGNAKCHAYLAGISLTLVVDHQPLVQIFNGYSLDQVENPRLLRLLMKTRTSFKRAGKRGSQHAVADALSRVPVTFTSTDDLLGEEVYAVRKMNLYLDATDAESDNMYFREIQAAAEADTEYVQLVDTIRNGFPLSFKAFPKDLRPYWNGRQQLSIDSGVRLKGHRIIANQAMRQSVLQDLHKAHHAKE